MMLNKTQNSPMVPREEERNSEQRKIDISVKRPEIDNGQYLQDIDFSITKWDGKAYEGMRQLPTVLEICINAALRGLAPTYNCLTICRDRSNV